VTSCQQSYPTDNVRPIFPRIPWTAGADRVRDDATSAQIRVPWGPRGGDAVALGTIDAVGSQIGIGTVGSGATGSDGFAHYGISIEPGRQAPSAPTEVVATGQVTS